MDPIGTSDRERARLPSLEERLAEALEELERLQSSMAELRRRATFPEQNPNLVIELSREGALTYVNPEALRELPDLAALGRRHPLLADFDVVVARFESGETEPFVREVAVDQAVYEEKWCPTYAGEALVMRLYAHDVTALKGAETAMQAMARQVITAQEAERHRVARELHDETGQALTALKISLQLALAELPPDAVAVAESLTRASTLVDTTRERIRDLARGLRPPALDAVGLNLSLEDACRTFAEHTGLAIHYTGDPTADRLPDVASVCVYRLLQEALANIARHADADQVAVDLAAADQAVTLMVRDNGRGFDPDAGAERRPARGLGLVGMAERLDLLGGTLDIRSAPGRGTLVVARVPMGEAS